MLLPEFTHLVAQPLDFLPNRVEFFHDFAHCIVTLFVMPMTFVMFPLGRFYSFSDMLGNVAQASVMKMLDSNSHVFQT